MPALPDDNPTVARPPVAAPPDDEDGRTRTSGGWRDFVHATLTCPPAGPGPSGPPSGLAIRELDRWVDQNRSSIDVGEYKLLRSIGTGAFGSVWEGQNFDTGEHVAIKFLSAGDDRWEAMLGEVKLLQALEGTGGIVTVKQVRKGTDAQPPFYVMPLANGGSLADVVSAAKKAARAGEPVVPVAEAVRVFTRVAEALAAVHRRGIHHCDLKPRNVLLHTADPGHPAQPLLADFGQAHLATDDTPALGTFFYMPPDQADAALKKARSDSSWDVYALGALMYELLVGEPPRRDEALRKAIKQTEHLDTKLRAYRDGVTAAPNPTAHRRLVDPLLADVVDRCLATDPAARPRDAGEVVDLLKKRAWWRHVRTPLAVGAAATFVFVALVAGGSAFAADRVYQRTTADVSREIDGSLTRTAWYGKGAVERALQDHVAFAEQHARVTPELRDRLTAAAATAALAEGDATRAHDLLTDRAAFDAFVAHVHEDAQKRWPAVEGRTVALLVVAGDTPTGGPARGFTLAREKAGVPAAADRADPQQASNYRTEWSFRDYFTADGNRFAEQGRPHPVVRRTHVSQTYQSRRDGSWRLDVITPVWAADGRVVGLLSVGLDVSRHLRHLIDMPDAMLADRQEIARALSAFVVNDRGAWVWHETGMAGLRADAARDVHRDPENLTRLARELAPKHGIRPDDLVPWKSIDRGIEDGPDRYVDPVALDTPAGGEQLLAHTLTFRPLAHSRYEENRGRVWGFVAQMPEAVALAPVDRLKRQLTWAGSVLVAALAALAVVLWVWLFRLLRGWEFAGHG
ncbi:protein kinase domain-containing protein [Urbifossiella limnaea]|uniref:Serine/threonine-protein kinase Pkn1 n=1 Tax=Urbifossiella limnaea TaxID=2528023 RepID=A0A517XPB3_9BACT|nr:protein kinase [Urbifossiella limnaea]QDU19347.1 Serine/threonine-protein kinase Pkn1 [Urbifossiella limnaea]